MGDVISVPDEEIAQHNAETEDAFRPGTFAWYIPWGENKTDAIQLVCITAMSEDESDCLQCVRVSGNPAISLPRNRLKGNVMYRSKGDTLGTVLVDLHRAS